MDNLTCKSAPLLRKVNKKEKQGKYEMDRLKQAEKKKRRLEKVLARSAAIRSELQKKKEGQQRLDKEEGAAIGEEDTDHMFEDTEMDRLKQAEKKKRRLEKALAKSAAIRSKLEKKKQKKKEEQQRLDEEEEDTDCMFEDTEFLMRGKQETRGGFEGNFTGLPCSSGAYVEEGCGWSNTELCPGLLAAQAISSLQIQDDANLNSFFVDRVLRG